MVHPDSHKVSRAPWYSGTSPGSCLPFAYGTITLFGVTFQKLQLDRQLVTPRSFRSRTKRRPATPLRQRLRALTPKGFGLVRFRSPLLTESRLLSFPQGTEMVHFPWLASLGLCVHPRMAEHDPRRVSPFGHPRIKACLRLPEAYRSLPRPSSPLCAKASTVHP